MSIYNDVFCTSAPSTWYGINHAIYLFLLVIMCCYTPEENNGFFQVRGRHTAFVLQISLLLSFSEGVIGENSSSFFRGSCAGDTTKSENDARNDRI